MKIVFYRSPNGQSDVLEFLNRLHPIERGRTLAIFDACQSHGLSVLTTRQIDGKIWEIKTYRYNRFFYFRKEDTLILFYAIKKQKSRIEKQDLKTLKERYLAIAHQQSTSEVP